MTETAEKRVVKIKKIHNIKSFKVCCNHIKNTHVDRRKKERQLTARQGWFREGGARTRTVKYVLRETAKYCGVYFHCTRVMEYGGRE